MKTAQALKPEALQSRPVLREPVMRHISGPQLDELFQVHGMYPPRVDCRDGAAAWTVRPEATLGDVLETLDQLLRQSLGIASALACDESQDQATWDLSEALLYLLRQARGMQSLVWPVVVNAVLDERAAPTTAGVTE